MHLLISLCKEPNEINDPDYHFVVFDTSKRKVIRSIVLNGMNGSENTTRGMGMCYFDDWLYAGMIAKEHRLASRLLAINIKTGRKRINKLVLTKSLHGLHPYGSVGPYTYLLANSTQNDILSLITVYEGEVITEDVYFDFLTQDQRVLYDWDTEYLHDDSFHNNSILKIGKQIYISMFADYIDRSTKIFGEEHWRKKKGELFGAIRNIQNGKPLATDLSMPHSILVDTFNNLLFCNSGTFELINSSLNRRIKCEGFTRGLCEDIRRGGYWVGLSYHRQFSTEVKGATLRFVPYDMDETKNIVIDLSRYGKEIFDILPFKPGRYN